MIRIFFKFWVPILIILTPFHPFSSSLMISQIDPAKEWNLLYLKIRDRLISKHEALKALTSLERQLKENYPKDANRDDEGRLCFPLRGYTFHSIGGKNGSGYQAQGYDFFDGNQHRGHPAHDIFIRDRDQDGLDDTTGKPVEVLSVSPGITVSVHLEWNPPSPIRGGNYVWIYDPITSRYYYYAHLNEVFVKPGEIVSRGDRIGTVGRTGLNAYPKRSPTHLHFSVHHSVDGYPKPINPYADLVRGCQR
jgi:murein DD-endopeptidase MepM/ murein hydrolase activator NlpD